MVIAIGASFLAIAGFYPSWVYHVSSGDGSRKAIISAGYSFILAPPPAYGDTFAPQIDVSHLVVLLASIIFAIVAGVVSLSIKYDA